MALNALCAFLYGISIVWFLLVYNTLRGLKYSMVFSGIFVGIAFRFFGFQDAIGLDDEDDIANWCHLLGRRVHYYCS